MCNPESRVRDFKFVRTPVLLIAESGAIDPGIRSPVLLSAEKFVRTPVLLIAESGSVECGVRARGCITRTRSEPLGHYTLRVAT